jgi:hypothetical protein
MIAGLLLNARIEIERATPAGAPTGGRDDPPQGGYRCASLTN